MKTEETTWSNDDDVLATFSSLGVFHSSKSSKEVKTPKHRISNSQLKMVNSHQGRSSLNPQNSHSVSFGRGKFLSNLKGKVPSTFPPCRTEKDIKEKDAALSKDIRAVTDLNFTNSAIENYIYFGCDADSDEVSSTNKEQKSADQISVTSDLRVDAADFYPPGISQIDPDKLVESLEKLMKEKKPCDSVVLPNSPKLDNYLIGFNTKETSSESEVINESVSSSTKKKSYLDSITVSSSSPSPSLQTNGSLFPYEKFKPFEEKNPKTDRMKEATDQPESKKPETRGKRVLKNALLLGLKNRFPEDVNEPNHLMKPSDFELSSKPSEFVPIKPEDTDEIVSPQPYDFFSDPTVDMETKSLVNSLISDDLSSDMSSSSISSEQSRKSKKSYSSFRPYNYQFKEEDFPALS